MCNRYGTPTLVADKDQERSFAELWTRHCANPFLEVALELLSRYARVRLFCCEYWPQAARASNLYPSDPWILPRRWPWSCSPAMPG